VRVDVTLQRAGMEKGGLILTSHDSMRSGALAYKAQKESEGYVVEEVVLSGSGLTAAAVRRRLRNVYFGVGGDYAVILGDTAQIPTFYSSAICSDLPYSLLDAGESFNDYLGRDLMLGRITLETSGAISNYVAKLAAFVANIAAKGNADLTWIAGGSTPSENDIAEGTHNWCISNCVPAEYHNQLFYRDNGSASELTAHINGGTDGVIYSGHGSVTSWQRYGYNVGSLAGLINNLNTPIVLGHCCLTSTFDTDQCFGEAWMETTARGIVYIGGSESTYWDEDDLLEREEFAAMTATAGLSIGAALETGLREVYNHYPARAEYYFTIYQLFGDPTVSLFGPPEFHITSPAALPNAYVNEPYLQTLTAAGGTPPYSWRITQGALPAGLTLDAVSGAIAGVPAVVQAYAFTVEATDAAAPANVATQSVTLYVAARLGITTPSPLPLAVLGSPYAVSIQGTGGILPYNWSVVGADTYLESDPGPGWIGGGVAQGWSGDDAGWRHNLPWGFPFYGAGGDKTTSTSLWICSNGFIDFDSEETAPNNSDTALKSRARIAPLWDNLVATNVFITDSADYVIVRWAGRTYSGSAPVSFEAVLYRNGNIRFNYGMATKGLTPTIGVSKGDNESFTLSRLNGTSSVQSNAAALFTYQNPLPSGLTFSSATGLLSGTPTSVGTNAFAIRVEDAGPPPQSAEQVFTLTVAPLPVLHVSVPARATEGALLVGLGCVAVEPCPTRDLAVALSSDRPAEASVPGLVTIVAGTTNVHFVITVNDDHLLDGTQTALIQASAADCAAGAAAIQIDDNETAVLSLRVPASVVEGAGVLTNQGQVCASAAVGADVAVALASDDETEISVPPTCIIPAGATSAVFNITAPDDWVNDGTQRATLTAQVTNWFDGVAGIDVLDDDGGTLHYVNVAASNPVPPYTSWAHAAQTIQDAVNAAQAGHSVLVNQGRYVLSAPVQVTNAITLRAVRTNEVKVDGAGLTGCFFLDDTNAVLDGFTITGGKTSQGGGVRCGTRGGTVRNCLITGNRAGEGGGVYSGRVENCTIVSNTGLTGGGTCGATVRNSIVCSNSVNNWVGGDYAFSCTFPLPGGAGNTSNAPTFVSISNFHLRAGSVGIDAGEALPNVADDKAGVARPLDGNNDGTAWWDMGAYEFVHAAADSDGDGLSDSNEVYGVGTDPTREDTDGDGQSDRAEVIAGENPLDGTEWFHIRGVNWIRNDLGAALAWQSRTGRLYSVFVTTNLMAPWGASGAPDIPGTGSPVSFTNPAQGPAGFYTIKVRLAP